MNKSFTFFSNSKLYTDKVLGDPGSVLSVSFTVCDCNFIGS